MNGGWRVKTQILAAGKNWIIHEHIEYIEHEQCFKDLTFSWHHQNSSTRYNYNYILPIWLISHGRQYKDQNWVKDIRRWPPQLVQKLDRFLRRETTWAEQIPGADGNGSALGARLEWHGVAEERQPVTTVDGMRQLEARSLPRWPSTRDTFFLPWNRGDLAATYTTDAFFFAASRITK